MTLGGIALYKNRSLFQKHLSFKFSIYCTQNHLKGVVYVVVILLLFIDVDVFYLFLLFYFIFFGGGEVVGCFFSKKECRSITILL